MLPPLPRDGARIVVLSGAGLSVASGIPTFRDADGLWEGHQVEDVATPRAWWRDREMVRRFYDQRRINCVHVLPNPGHEALARLQQRWGPKRVVLVTQNIDGLLQKAGAADVIEMHGSLWSLQCEEDEQHPHIKLYGKQNRERKCSMCGAVMRPDVGGVGELPRQ
jgi:NAD-dependent deacetylase